MKYKNLVETYKEIALSEDGHEQKANVMNQLTHIKRNAEELIEGLNPDSEYPSWWVNKLVKSADYLDTATDYLQNKVDQGEVQEALVMRDMDIARSIFHKLENDMTKLLHKKQDEKFFVLLQKIASVAGVGVTKKKQAKGKTYSYDLKK